MAETTESNEAGTRQPLEVAAPLLAVLGAFSGGLVGEMASEFFGPALPRAIGGITAAILAAAVAAIGHWAGSRIDRRHYAVGGGWRGLLLVVGTFVGFGSGFALMKPLTLVPSVAAALVGCAGLFVGAIVGARIGETLDRWREITGRSRDADAP